MEFCPEQLSARCAPYDRSVVGSSLGICFCFGSIKIADILCSVLAYVSFLLRLKLLQAIYAYAHTPALLRLNDLQTGTFFPKSRIIVFKLSGGLLHGF
jgi:hypothetical protein